MKLSITAVVIGSVISFGSYATHNSLDPSASAPGLGIIEGQGLQLDLTSNSLLDNQAEWQMGNGLNANVVIDQDSPGTVNGNIALVDTGWSSYSEVYVEQDGELNAAEAKLRGHKNDASIVQDGSMNGAEASLYGRYNVGSVDQDGTGNQALLETRGYAEYNNFSVTQVGDNNVSQASALGGADDNMVDVDVTGNGNTTYSEFENYYSDHNDVEITINGGDGNYVETVAKRVHNEVDVDLVGSNDNRVFIMQKGSYSDATVNLISSDNNQFSITQTINDTALVTGNGAYGNVGLIIQN